MKKLLILLLLVSSVVYGAGVFLENMTNRDGVKLIRVVNGTNTQLYCYVTYDNGYNYYDFYVNPNSYSRWYYEPTGYYEWRCN